MPSDGKRLHSLPAVTMKQLYILSVFWFSLWWTSSVVV